MKTINFQSVAATLLSSRNVGGHSIQNALEDLDDKLVRTIALANLLDSGKVPFRIKDTAKEFSIVKQGRVINSSPYDAMVLRIADLLDVDTGLGTELNSGFEEVLFASSMYISSKVWSDMTFMGGVLGKLFCQEGSILKMRPEINLYPEDFARKVLQLKSFSTEELFEYFPRLGKLMDDVNEEKNALVPEFNAQN